MVGGFFHVDGCCFVEAGPVAGDGDCYGPGDGGDPGDCYAELQGVGLGDRSD